MQTIEHGKTFEILSFINNPNKTDKGVLFNPYSVKRISDNEIFNIGDLFIHESLELVASITGFSLLENILYVEHTHSKIGLGLEDIKKYNPIITPSMFNLYQVVSLQFKEEPITATIRGVHFFNNNTKYDLQLWLKGTDTRIYNVEEKFIKSL